MTINSMNMFAVAALTAGVAFAPRVAEAGGAPSSSEFDPTSGHNIIQMSDSPETKAVETGGASSSTLTFDPTTGLNIIQMNGTMVKRSGVPSRSGGGKDGGGIAQ